MNHYPRHIGDYLKKTLALTMAQDGAYGRAIDWYYDHEGPLPRKPDVYGELRCMNRADRVAVDVVLAKYFTETPDGYRHDRCDEELERYRHRAETARINGANGGRPPNQTETQSVISGKPKHNPRQTESKTSQNHNHRKATEKRQQTESPAHARGRPLTVHERRADTADQMYRRGKYAPAQLKDDDERDITSESKRLS